MSTADSLQKALQNLKIKSASSSGLNKRELKLALEAFSDYNSERRVISLAYAYLASVLLGTGDQVASSKKVEAQKHIKSLLDSWLSETSFPDLSKAFAALTAILEVNKATFDDILQQDGTEDRILEAGEIICADYKIVDPVDHIHVKGCLASFISQAAAQASNLAKKLANPDDTSWLYRRLLDNGEDMTVRVAAAVAFIKLQSIAAPRANASASSLGSSSSSMLLPTTADVFKVLKEAVNKEDSTASHGSLQLGLEGLGVATLKPSVRRLVSHDRVLMESLLKIAADPSRQFSTAVIFDNLVTYLREEDTEEKVKASIRRYASQGDSKQEEAETKEEMDKRCSELLQAGIMPVLISYSKSPSQAVQRLCGKILLGLVENVKYRGMIIQHGGAKALLEVVLKSTLYKTPDAPMIEDYIPVQALAKLLITSNPLMVLGPTPQSPLLITALKPLSAPILHDGSTLLQRFESLMALTNITSLSEGLQERLSSVPSFLDKIETIVIESDSSTGGMMCRRAAVELLCNLASSETTFIRYTAIDKEADIKEGTLPGSVASRIGILLALSDAEDKATREAALGALATFTLASTISQFIGADDSRYQRLLHHLSGGDDDEDGGMQLRAIECLKNIARSTPTRREQIDKLFRAVSRESPSSNITPALVEALEDLSRPV